jgi:ECF transporter S component (folate family)
MKSPFHYVKDEMIKFRKPIVLVLMGLFVALAIVLARVTNWYILPTQRVNFSFLATAIASIVLGPFLGAINAAVADIVGYFLFPAGGAFFPGFTITAIVNATLFGLFLYKKPVTILRVALAVLCVSLIGDFLLNTVWLSILFQKAWFPLLITRILKTVLWYPVQVLVIYYVWRYVGVRIRYIQDL